MGDRFLSFVACPNPIHVGDEGWKSWQLYYAGNGIFKCNSCGKEFTREEVQIEIQKDYTYKLQDLQRWYQQSLADLHKNNLEHQDTLNNLGEK